MRDLARSAAMNFRGPDWRKVGRSRTPLEPVDCACATWKKTDGFGESLDACAAVEKVTTVLDGAVLIEGKTLFTLE